VLAKCLQATWLSKRVEVNSGNFLSYMPICHHGVSDFCNQSGFECINASLALLANCGLRLPND